jgi:hypothetical protein
MATPLSRAEGLEFFLVAKSRAITFQHSSRPGQLKAFGICLKSKDVFSHEQSGSADRLPLSVPMVLNQSQLLSQRSVSSFKISSPGEPLILSTSEDSEQYWPCSNRSTDFP